MKKSAKHSFTPKKKKQKKSRVGTPAPARSRDSSKIASLSSLPGWRSLSGDCTRIHLTLPPGFLPSGQLSTYTAPISNSSLAMSTQTSASLATASHAEHSSFRGSLTVQCRVGDDDDEVEDEDVEAEAEVPEERGVEVNLCRSSSMASRSGHGEEDAPAGWG